MPNNNVQPEWCIDADVQVSGTYGVVTDIINCNGQLLYKVTTVEGYYLVVEGNKLSES